MIHDLIARNRSYRRFVQSREISRKTLVELVELARLSPSATNLQPLKYVLCHTPKRNAEVFEHLAWAGFLKDWPGPAEGERPSAYIIILGDKRISNSFGCDYGIVAQSMLLGAVEQGLGGCMIGSIQRDRLREALKIADHFEVLLVVAIGKPSETVVIDDVDSSGNIEYWRGDDEVHHVPKRSMEDLVVDTL